LIFAFQGGQKTVFVPLAGLLNIKPTSLSVGQLCSDAISLDCLIFISLIIHMNLPLHCLPHIPMTDINIPTILITPNITAISLIHYNNQPSNHSLGH